MYVGNRFINTPVIYEIKLVKTDLPVPSHLCSADFTLVTTMAESELNAAPAQPLRLPAFTPMNPEAWFQRAETIFRNRNITTDRKKADAVLEYLPDDVWNIISPWIGSLTDTVDYKDLKKQLLKIYSATPSERAKQFFARLYTDIGDMRPSHLLYEMRKLLTMPQTESDAQKPIDLLREMVLTTLPPAVRAAIPNASEMDEETFLKVADDLMIAHTAAKKVIAPAAPELPAAEEEPPEPHAAPVKNQTQRRPFRRRQQQYLCYYHWRYGNEAKRCEGPCSKSQKNTQ